MAIKSIPRKVFRSSRAPVKFTGKNDVIFSVPNFLVRFEKHPKAVSGALRDRFRAQEVFGSFEKRMPGLKPRLLDPEYSALNHRSTMPPNIITE